DCTLARELVARAEQGVGAFNAPASIRRGDTVRIQLVLALAPPPPPPPPPPAPETSPVDADVATPAPEAPAEADGSGTREPATAHDEVRRAAKPPPTPAETVAPLPGETVEFTPVVGRHMAAELSGEGFDIVAKSPRAQDVLPDSQTSWEWDVTARVKGPHTLTLKTLVEAEFADGQRYALRSLSTNKTIEVTVTPMGRVSDAIDAAVEWLGKTTNLLTALAGTIAAAVAVWAALRRRKD
ncbi:MAG TPA: hypothetical protein PK808_03545, partial [Polymorphobacter sp.]|nr:hypothetical protein [Polymorphobacter sp.]